MSYHLYRGGEIERCMRQQLLEGIAGSGGVKRRNGAHMDLEIP